MTKYQKRVYGFYMDGSNPEGGGIVGTVVKAAGKAVVEGVKATAKASVESTKVVTQAAAQPIAEGGENILVGMAVKTAEAGRDEAVDIIRDELDMEIQKKKEKEIIEKTVLVSDKDGEKTPLADNKTPTPALTTQEE